MIFILWLVLAMAAGWLGADRQIGYWPSLLISLLLSPLIGFIFVFASKKLSDIEQENVQKNHMAKMEANTSIDALHKLNDLREKGILTDDEFQQKKEEFLKRVI